MVSKMIIHRDGLATLRGPFQSRTIRLRDIQSVEVYGKSIVPPLVSATFISVVQMFFLAVRGSIPVLCVPDFSNLILLVFNVPIILCILLALLRAKYTTLRMTFQNKERSLAMGFVRRSVAEKLVAEYSRLRDST